MAFRGEEDQGPGVTTRRPSGLSSGGGCGAGSGSGLSSPSSSGYFSCLGSGGAEIEVRPPACIDGSISIDVDCMV